MEDRIAVILLNLGGPEDLSQVPVFLKRLLSDPQLVPLRWPLRHLVAQLATWTRKKKVTEHYRAIGGRSPIFEQTQKLIRALALALGDEFFVTQAYRHSRPTTQEVVSALVRNKFRRIIGLSAYPQWSFTTSAAALSDLVRACEHHPLELAFVPAYPDADGYIQALAQGIQPFLHTNSTILLSAHGLMQRQIQRGDPYLSQVKRSVNALGRYLDHPVHVAFQSRVGPVRWTRPYLKDEIYRLAQQGKNSLIVAPISFVVENFETCYELDIELRAYAQKLGFDFLRSPAPGHKPCFINELTNLVRQSRQRGFCSTDKAKSLLVCAGGRLVEANEGPCSVSSG